MSASLSVAIPDIGDYKNVPVIEIMVKPGDRIAVDDPILSVESDKATMEVPSPVAGVVRELLIEIGSKVSQGTPILTVEPTASIEGALQVRENRPATPADEAQKNRQPLPSPAAGPKATAVDDASPGFSSVHATPSVRAYARELDVDLTKVRPTGSRGRILREDVQTFIKTSLASATPASSGGQAVGVGLPAWPQIDFAKYGEIDRQPLTRIQQISGANLTRNWLTIPHVTNFDHADVTELEAFRTDLNREKRKPEVKVTMVAFLLKSASSALRAFPRFNASLDGDHLVLKKYVHIGFAVDTPKGLMVPIIRDVDKKGLLQIALEMGELAEKARQGTLSPSDMQGGCFSVSSLGGIGGGGFTPIINAPEVAILGAARSKTEAVWNGEVFVPRLITPISLSWDHRVVDGVAAARFLGHIAATLGDFRRALL
ncbi:dihydrolipoyllysine-residue acetyltransferase [Mesorhizobium shangrilense]|uniref:Acetyltransferase component of pyruvate dehydrogenase complex n=1 Tax=Mesorhizobium shangrilense TaxID=460060 RepID=A0ABV2DHQ5_9HYPH